MMTTMGATPEPTTLLDWLPEPLAQFWRLPLFSVEGVEVTLGHVMLCLTVLVLGLIGARIFSRVFVSVLTRRTRIHPGAAAATRSLLFYALALMVLLLALDVVNFPLRLFAFAGGALAIGVGFASQNILSNFISGLILLIERPVRVGDVVQFDGSRSVTGVIRRIGARSTRIVTGENLEVVVPNSTLVEQNVVNWTLSSDEIRASITVGVAYGSPLEEALGALRRAAAEHGSVLRDPAPVATFEEFGDSSLVLTLYFWMRIHEMFERRVVQSDLRLATERLLRERGIVVAFPQRDVHLDTAGPLEVRVVGRVEGGGRIAPKA
ncbi:MAG TPA: mechanosensitive ion channel [Phycisphaerales bacterium]|nr:mechanosensitive ion channel [Phycisphaerales bacterium]